ncbi:MAG TPA: RDD family protein [Thermoanaerobaculia bacterium]|nr:RDD family protein [Thermoanaerobaculia bacterium]
MALIDTSQTTLLRIGAFLVDALSISIVLILPASAVSYAMAWVGGSVKAIQIVWWAALAILLTALVIRDGFKGRSLGKQMLGLRLLTPRGEGCGWGRSVIRNLPLVIFPWTLIEVFLVVAGKPRTGDRIAKTTVSEE